MAVLLRVSEVTSDAAGVEYRRRRPELGELYRVVADNYRTLEAAADQNVTAPLPSFVKDEFSGYLDCGVLGRGFGFLQCKNAACRQKLLAAFSCTEDFPPRAASKSDRRSPAQPIGRARPLPSSARR